MGRLRFDLSEISGSLGDLGTFLPLAFGAIAVNGLHPTSVFLCAGFLYVASGLYFRVPMPVQPLKAMTATAIAVAAAPADIAAAGFVLGALFLAVAAFRLDRRLARLFPRPVVRGIQLGLSVLLLKAGWDLVVRAPGSPIPGPAPLPAPAGLLAAAVVAGLVILSRVRRAFPSALLAVLFGLLCGTLYAAPGVLESLRFGFPAPQAAFPWGGRPGGTIAALLLPQLALTFGNSIVATADACGRYYGAGAARVTTRGLSVSVGAANVLAALAGGIPMCHGSGGVTAHHRFGARTAGANVLIGSLFVLVALGPAPSLSGLSGLLPAPVLGVLLMSVGIQHAGLARDVARAPRELAVALFIGAVTLLSGNLSIAFAAGIPLHFALSALPRPGTASAPSGVPL